MSTACIETWKNPAAVDSFARHHYRDELEFHNYPHAGKTVALARILAAAAIRNGADIDEEVLMPAGDYHDAGSHLLPTIDHPFPIREDYAADVAAHDMRPLGMPEPKIELMKGAIRSTNNGVACESDTARCLRQADLMAGGIMSHPAVFLNGTYHLYLESLRLKGLPQPEDPQTLKDEFMIFGANSHKVLGRYLQEDVALGGHQRNAAGESMFNLLAARNVALLEPDRLSPILAVNLDYIVDYKPVSL